MTPLLTQQERDERLIRLDERVQSIQEEKLPAIEEHLKTLNGNVARNTERSIKNAAAIEEHKASNCQPKFYEQKWFWLVVAISVLALAGVDIANLLSGL